MGYQYTYDSNKKSECFCVSIIRIIIFSTMFLMLFILLISYCWPEGMYVLKRYMYSFEDIRFDAFNCLSDFLSDIIGVKFG